MERILSVASAKVLIEFIEQTNYELAPEGDGLFDGKEEALRFVESESYKPEEALSICFDTVQGNYMDSVVVTSDGEVWELEDSAMGGFYASGDTIEAALISYRSQYHPSDDYCPVALSIES